MTTPSHPQAFDDPIVAEIRQIRADLAREANYNLHTICEQAREAERRHPERLIQTPPPTRQEK